MTQQINKLQLVKEFHEAYNAHINSETGFPSPTIRSLRQSLLEEQFKEYLEAEKTDNFVEVCDALGDMLYIIYGTALSYGIPIDEVFYEIHKSNMSKLDADGNPIYRSDGKVLKGPFYFKPNIPAVLANNKE